MNIQAEKLLETPAPGIISSTGNYNTHYLQWGRGQEPLLVLHKVTGSGESWLPMLGRFEDQFELYAPDLLGHGYSNRSNCGYGLSVFCDQLEKLISYIGKTPITLMGHSLGARIAIALACRIPKNIKALICIEPPLSGPNKAPYPYDLNSVLNWRDNILLEGSEYCLRTNKSYSNHDAEIRARYGILCDHDLLKEVWDGFKGTSMDAFLKELSCPTLLVRGDNGVISNDQAKEVAAINPDIKIKQISGCGHNPPWDNNDAFQYSVLSFLDSI